nr:hypothetical protein [Candidatus Omnitrophota bacterium]
PLQELEPVRDRLRWRSGSSYDAKEDENILNQAMHSVYPSDYFSRGGYFYTLSQMARDELEKGVKPWSGVDAETIQGWAQKLYPQSMSYWDIEKVSIGAVGHDEFEIWAARLNAVREKLLYQNDQAQKALAEVMGRGLFDGASLQRELQTQRQAFEALSFSAKDFWDPDKPGHYKTAAEAREDSQSRAFHLFSDRFPKRLEDPSWDTLDVFMGVSLAVKAQGLKTAVEVQGGETFEIRNAKSPLMPGAVEVSLAGDAEHPQFVILGANKSGKTSLIRTVQALILLARKGLPVPAEMRIPAYEKILTFFGASESMTEGKSYFRMVSERLLSILNNATPNSMVIMDEIHGSDYWELSALQAAILKYLHDIGATVILNTHMREGLALAKDIPSLKFFKTDVARAEDGTLHFSYKVLEDPEITSQSFGIESVKDHLTSEQYQRALKIRNDLALEMAERKKRAAEYRELIAAVAALPEDTALRKILEQSKGMEIENVVEEYQQLFSGQEILQHKVADLVDQPEQWEPLFVAPVQKALLALKQPGDHDDLELDLKKILTLAKLREWILLGHEDSIQLLMTMRSEVRSRSISGTRRPSLALARAEVRTMAASSDEEMFRQLETLFSESNLSLDQLQSRLRSILPPAAQVTLTEKYFYANRKKIPNADRFFKMLFDYLSQHETIGNQRMIRVQDFNFKDAQVGAANIAYAQTPMAVRDKAYQMLTPAEREVMFGEFLSRLKANPKVFHIDHHYDFPVLASTSTTVLLIDFLLYLHAQQEEALIGALHTRSFALMDHADADILLSHFVMEHANDADFLQANQKILSATVLFNDYLVMPQDAAVQSAMLIFYYTFLAIEENVVSGVWTYDEGLRKAGLALAFGLRMAQTQSAAQLYTTLQANRDRHAQETEKEFAALFFRGAKRDFDNRAVLQNMVNLGNFDSTDLVPGMVRKMGPILFFYVADDEPKEIWSSSAYQYLLTERPDLLKGISAIVVSTPVSAAESTSGKPARLFKIRTFMDEDGHFLNLSEPFWKGLREQGYKEAGGRGMAGSLSKSPIENADMSKAVRAYSSAIERLLLLEAVPDEIHSDVARTAILQAVRHKPDGIVARIVAAIPHLYTAEALGGQGLTATTVLQQLNAKKKYALRLGWDRGARLLSLVEDDGFYIGINNEPQTWIDIDKPIWTERVSAKHPWWPLVDALIAGLRPDQQRLINEQVGYGPRLAALYASARSEVRTIVGDHFADEDASYRQWENDFENARRLKGAVLQAALERQKASVRAFVKHYGQTRRKIRTLLERYGFRKSTGQNGVYEFVISDEAQVRLDGDNLKLNSDQVDFLRLDVLQAAVKIIMQHRHYVPADLPRGEGQDQAYMEKSIFSFWNFVSGKLSDLFRPLNNDDKEITWGQLRTLVMDLWTSIQVLQDIQSAPLNEYHERHKIARLFPVNSILASGLSKAAFEASLKNLFTKQDGLVLKQLQLDLERLHFQTAKTLIEFERSLGGQRSEMRVGAVDAFAQPRHLPKVAMIDLNDVVTFSSEEIRETAIVMKQRPEVRFVIYDADPAQANLIHFKRLFSFRNVDWTQSSGEEAYQALGPKFKEGKVVSFSRGDEEGGNVFSAPSRKKIRQFKLSPKKTGTMAVALSFDPEDPRYHWGILREGDFYVVADALASLAVNFLNQFVVAISA